MKITGITKRTFSDNSTAYYLSYQIGENCFVIKIMAKQYKEFKKNGIPLY